MMLRLQQCTVIPIMWIPDIYVNPSNNANLQSANYKSIDQVIRRSGNDFLDILRQEIKKAKQKRETNKNKNN